MKLGLAVVSGALLSTAVSAYATLTAFERELRAIKASHYGFAVDEIAQAITARTDLGLRLETISEIPQLFGRIQAAEPDIDRLLVFDEDGRVLFSTDQTDLGAEVARRHLGGRRVEADERALTVSSPLINNFGKAVGGVLLESGARHREPLLERARITGFGLAAAVVAISLLLAFLLSGWALRPTLHMLGRFASSLMTLAEGKRAEPDEESASLAALNDTAGDMLDRLDAEARKIDRLDRIG